MLTVVSKQFLIREFATLRIMGTEYRIAHIEEIVDVLDAFLMHPASDDRVAGLGQKVATAITQLAENSPSHETLSGIIDALSSAFESFLKKLALIKYPSDQQRLYGDATFVGLLDMTLGKLLEGKLQPQRTRSRTNPGLVSAHLVSFSYQPSTFYEQVHFQTREIRNRVHECPSRTINQLRDDITTVLGSYCLALEENLTIIRPQVDPIFRYLAQVRDVGSEIEKFYVDTNNSEHITQQSTCIDDLLVTEWSDSIQFRYHSVDSTRGNPTDASSPLTGTIAEIASKRERFWLVGEPGSGKSTSLRRIASQMASASLVLGHLAARIPIVIPATLLTESYSFDAAIQDLLRVSTETVKKLLSVGQVILYLITADR